MVLLLLALAAAPQVEPRAQARAQASAFVRIAEPVRASRQHWERQDKGVRNERKIVDEQGRPLLLRLIELP